MISAIIIIAAIIGLVYLGTLLQQYPGYIEIGLASGSFQMPIWYFLIALILAIFAVMILFKVVWTILRIPAIGKRFGRKRRDVKSSELLQKGMLAMGKGEWKKAEKLLAKGARVSYKGKQDTGLYLTCAAEAAQKQGADERRDQYLLEARMLAAEGADTFTAALAEAQIHLDAGQPEKALSALAPHHNFNYETSHLQAIESQAHEQLGHYDKVWTILQNQKKAFSNKSAFYQRQADVAKALFNAQNSDLDTIEKVWSELPSQEKKDETLFLSYVSALINHEQKDKAEATLARRINNDYSDPLIHAYTQLEVGSARQRLDKLAKWLKNQPTNTYLNYGAAKLAFQLEEYASAKDYAERSVKAQALPESLALLGKIYEKLGQESNALQAYRHSVGLSFTEPEAGVSGEVLPAADASNALPQQDKVA